LEELKFKAIARPASNSKPVQERWHICAAVINIIDIKDTNHDISQQQQQWSWNSDNNNGT